jgi:hypothetical protein
LANQSIGGVVINRLFFAMILCFSSHTALSKVLESRIADMKTVAWSLATGSGSYTHRVRLDLYLPKGFESSEEDLKRRFFRVQKMFDYCGVMIDVERLVEVNATQQFWDWESLQLDFGKVTEWEKIFFSAIKKGPAGVLFVNSIDWTIGDDGPLAVGYGDFPMEDIEMNEEERAFFLNKMTGFAVVGRSQKEWTIEHELGHGLLNLAHTDSPDNIMFPFRKTNPKFSKDQCRIGLLSKALSPINPVVEKREVEETY